MFQSNKYLHHNDKMRPSEGQKKIELNQMILEWKEMRSKCL